MSKEIDYNLMLYRPLITGGAGGLMSLALVSSGRKIDGYNAHMVLGLGMAGASLVSAASHEFILDNVLGDQQSDMVYSIQAPMTTGLATVAMGYGVFGKGLSMKAAGYLFGLGVAAEMAGSYTSEALDL
jgi:hypothetical protein